MCNIVKFAVVNDILKFRLNIKEGANATLKIKTLTIDETYEIVNGLVKDAEGYDIAYIELDMRAFEMYDGIITLTETLTDGENVGTYDLKAYANSDSVKNEDNQLLNDYLIALYNYCRESKEYRDVSAKDFGNNA